MKLRRPVAIIILLSMMLLGVSCGKKEVEGAERRSAASAEARGAEGAGYGASEDAEVNATEASPAAVTEQASAGSTDDTHAGVAEAEAADVPEHVHEYARHNGVLACMADEGVVDYYYCEGCDTYFDYNYNEIDAFHGNHTEADPNRLHFILRDLQVDYFEENIAAEDAEYNELFEKCKAVLLREPFTDADEEEADQYAGRMLDLREQNTALTLTCYRVYEIYPEYEEYYDTVMNLFTRGNDMSVKIYELIPMYDRALGRDPDEAESNSLLVERQERLNRLDEESSALERRFLTGEFNGYADYLNELIPLLNEMAHEMGYDNYEDYAYASIWNRNYTAEDVLALGPYLKEYYVPFVREYSGRQAELYWTVVDDPALSSRLDEFFLGSYNSPFVRATVDRVGGLYQECYNELLENGYLFIGPKYSGGMSHIANLPAGEHAICLLDNGRHYTAVPFIHEFGHYCSPLMADNSHSDLEELYSYGSELMLASYAETLRDNYADDPEGLVVLDYYISSIKSMIIDDVVSDYVFAALFHYICTHEDLTDEAITSYYEALALEYSLNLEECPLEAYMYSGYSFYFSYPTYMFSKLYASKLYLATLRDFETGRDLYLSCFDPALTSIPPSDRASYLNLGDPFSEDFYRYFKLDK